jgi:hypothetical protein
LAKFNLGYRQGKVDKKNSLSKVQLKNETFLIWTQESKFKIF